MSYDYLEKVGSVQWPCNEAHPLGSPIMHTDGFVRGKGKFIRTEYVATDEKTGPRYPLLLTTGRILSQYNVGAQTRRTANVIWHEEDVLEIHPHDAEQRGVRDGDWVKLTSRAGETTLRAHITERVAPGVVYTTFHHPNTQVNVVTTEFSDWASYFALGAAKRAAAEAGIPRVVTPREADDLLRAAEQFVAVVESSLGVAYQPPLAA